IWKYRHLSNGKWCDPCCSELIFDSNVEIFKGFGEDGHGGGWEFGPMLIEAFDVSKVSL
ncbi:unnamed protein product, partial [Rotaria magnacalcarata]